MRAMTKDLVARVLGSDSVCESRGTRSTLPEIGMCQSLL
jgi:hypothetical protein